VRDRRFGLAADRRCSRVGGRGDRSTLRGASSEPPLVALPVTRAGHATRGCRHSGVPCACACACAGPRPVSSRCRLAGARRAGGTAILTAGSATLLRAANPPSTARRGCRPGRFMGESPSPAHQSLAAPISRRVGGRIAGQLDVERCTREHSGLLTGLRGPARLPPPFPPFPPPPLTPRAAPSRPPTARRRSSARERAHRPVPGSRLSARRRRSRRPPAPL
jgi:hypothetical protein